MGLMGGESLLHVAVFCRLHLLPGTLAGRAALQE
jgi:hypothetical protein